MSYRDDADRLGEHDQDLLKQIGEFVVFPDACAGSPDHSTRLLDDLARSAPRVDDGFRLILRQRLVAEHSQRIAPRPVRSRLMIRWLKAWSIRLRPGILAAAAALILVLLVVSVAVGQGRLVHVTPIEVTTMPPVTPDETGRVLSRTNVASEAELQRLLSFPLLVPADLPSRCSGPYQRAYQPESQSATLVYQCLTIEEWKGDRVISPIANQGTVEDVLVNGEPALFFEQASFSVSVGASATSKTRVDKLIPAIPELEVDGGANTGPTLIFERDGVIVWISSFPYQQPRRAPVPTKADLIRVAESMR